MDIPVCETCQQRIRDRYHRGGVRGLRIGMVLFCGLALLLAWNKGWQEPSLLMVVTLAALAVGGLGGFLIGTLSANRPLAELRNYSPSRGTLSLRFRQPEYAAQVLAAIRRERNERAKPQAAQRRRRNTTSMLPSTCMRATVPLASSVNTTRGSPMISRGSVNVS